MKNRLKQLAKFLQKNKLYAGLIVYTIILFALPPLDIPLKIALALGAACLIYALPTYVILIWTLCYLLLLLVIGRASDPGYAINLYLYLIIYIAVEFIHIVLSFVEKKTRVLLEP